jgi:hypothetical protein
LHAQIAVALVFGLVVVDLFVGVRLQLRALAVRCNWAALLTLGSPNS